MKKSVKIFLTALLFMLACTALFCACDGQTQSPPPHEHIFEVKEETPATCTKDGYGIRQCTLCHVSENYEIPALGHEMSPSERKEPDCVNTGYIIYSCGRCGQTQLQTLPAAGHKWGDIITIKEATCKQEGLRSAVCSECGLSEPRQVVPKLPHSYGQWTEVTPPDCVNAGSQVRECKVCGHSDTGPIPALGHDFSTEYTVDIQPTPQSEGQKSKHCLRAGCNARTSVLPVDKLSQNTAYTVTLRGELGEELPDCSPHISVYGGGEEPIAQADGVRASFTLPTGEYTVNVDNLPAGYSLPQGNQLTYLSPDLELRAQAALITDCPPPYDLKYRLGYVMYDMEVDVIELDPSNDRKAKLSEIFSGYKAVLLNMYFCSCGVCVSEMPSFVRAYNTLAPSGKPYGSEVACVMLDAYENAGTIRQFKQRTNYKLPSYAAEYNIPMIMIHDPWLRAYFDREMVSGYPTSMLIDCRGVILEKHVGAMSANEFTSAMQRGINRYYALHPELAGQTQSAGTAPILTRCDIAPYFTTSGKEKV